VDLFERALTELGFRGLKVYPPCGFSPSDPTLFPYYELCSHHKAPVLVHIGATSPALAFDTSSPLLIDEAARRFPAVNFILAHGAVSFVEECVMMCAFRPNVYLDLSAFQGSVKGGGPSQAVRDVVSRGINHKILFGTDWPVFRMQGNQKTFVQTVVGDGGPLSGLKEIERDLILHKNIERLLGGATPHHP
jgi:predicted TIM-barrel fold metal-dependent hydrolase